MLAISARIELAPKDAPAYIAAAQKIIAPTRRSWVVSSMPSGWISACPMSSG